MVFTTTIHAEDDDQKLFKRRVLVFDFQNIAQSKDHDYLSATLGDNLYSQVQATDQFILLDKDKGPAVLKKAGLNRADLEKKKNISAVGRKAGADVVLTGTFVVLGSALQMNVRVFDMEAGRMAIVRQQESTIDGTIFAKIRDLMQSISTEMKDKLPPLPERTVVVEEDTFTGAMIRSGILPGWGQNYMGSPVKGTGMMVTGGFLLTGLAFTTTMTFLKKAEYDSVERGSAQSDFDDPWNSYLNYRKITLWGASLYALFYAYNLVDLIYFTEGNSLSQNSGGPSPTGPVLTWSPDVHFVDRGGNMSATRLDVRYGYRF